jgi:RNA polymerase sigma-70 factor, ECF subfamily
MSSLSGTSNNLNAPRRAEDVAGGEEVELFRKAREGDRGAFGQIVIRYQDRLYNGILRMVGDVEEARDLTQETFTRALAKIESFRSEAQPYTWIFRIGMNLAISQLRKVQRHRVFSLDRPNGRAGSDDQASGLVDRVAHSTESPQQIAERHERNKVVLAAMGRLDPEYRAVLVMRDIEGFDYQQMAAVLELPLGTLKSRLFRARLALRDELRQYLK